MVRAIKPSQIGRFHGSEPDSCLEKMNARAVPIRAIEMFSPSANASSFPLNHLTIILETTTMLVSAPGRRGNIQCHHFKGR
jgi:hypothetical protein